MISSTIYSKGRDNFKDYTFSAREWSAPTMVSPKEIQERIDSFALCGRKIKRMRLIGLSYFHTRDWVEEAAYRQVEHLPEEERQRRSNYPTIDPTTQFSRYAQIDEPILIEFEDGNIFEIDTPQEPDFRMSMNCIPWWINAGTNQPNIEADILFSPCIGQEIVSVEVNTRIADKNLFEYYPRKEMMDQTWQFMYAFNHEDTDIYDCIITDENPSIECGPEYSEYR